MSPSSDEGSSTDVAAPSGGAPATPGPRTAVVPAPEPGTDSTPKEARWQRDDPPPQSTPKVTKRTASPKSAPAKPPASTDADANSSTVVAPPAPDVKPTPPAKPQAVAPAEAKAPDAKATPPAKTPDVKPTPAAKPQAVAPAEAKAPVAKAAPVVTPTQPSPAPPSPAPAEDAPKTVAAPVAVVARTATLKTTSTDDANADADADDSMVVESRGRFGPRERFRARRVRRLVRHVDPWSVFKLTLVLNVCMWFIFLVAGVTMWSVARSSGTIDNFEKFIAQSFSLTDVSIDADLLFRVYSLIGLIITLALTGAAVIGSILFNLISDLIGGVWVSVIEEETAEPL